MTLFPDFSRYDRVALDTETDGLGYRNRPVGLSWATPDGRSGYMGFGHEEGSGASLALFHDANNCSLADVRAWAARELRPDLLTVYHNAPFDLRMLAYVGIRPASRVEDTLVAAPVLNELEPGFSLSALSKKYLGRSKSDDQLNDWCAQAFGGPATRKAQAPNYWRAPSSIVGPYACGDTELTLALYDHLRPKVTAESLDEIYALETAIVPIVVDMHLTGVRVDLDAAHALDVQLTRRIDALRGEWERLAPGVDPGKTYTEVVPLFEKHGLPVALRKRGELATAAEGGTPSIWIEDLERIAHPIAQTLHGLRQLTRHRDLFVRTYVLANADETGVVHGEFHALRSDEFGAVSGRFSSGLSDGSLNLQNLPKRSDKALGKLIRGLFVPYHKGWRWLKADYSQIQFRFLAHYAALLGHDALAKAYRAGAVDFHDMCAGLTGIPRDDAKHINFGLVFGMGKKKLAQKLGRSLGEAEKVIDTYHAKLPAVRATYDRLSDRVNQKGQIRTWGGRVRRFESAADAQKRGWRIHKGERFVGCHKGLNALLQGSEGDLIKRAMVALRPIAKEHGALLHMTVHDELNWSAAPEQAAPFARRVREAMEDYKLEVPVRAVVSVGADWGHSDEDVEPRAEAA